MIDWRVLWTRTARRDLEAIVASIATDSLDNALAVLDRLGETAASLTMAAERGRLVPDLQSIGLHHYRELIERPGRIVCRIAGDSVMVLAVLGRRRDLESVLLERLVRS